LRTDGTNTLAMAVIATEPSTLTPVTLAVAGVQRGGVPVSEVRAPAR